MLDLNMKEMSLFEIYNSPAYNDTFIALKLADEKIQNAILKTKGTWTKKKLNEIKAEINNEINKAYGGLFENMQGEVSAVSQVIAGAYVSNYSLPNSVIDDLINSNRQIQGYGFKELFDTTEANHARQLRVLLSSGVAQGQTALQIAREIGVKNSKLSKGQLKTNIYTTISDSRKVARHKSYEQLEKEDIIKGYIYDATLDGRTTIYCREQDQRKYYKPINEIAHLINVHFNCRSLYIGITETTQESRRASQFGQVENQNYETWFNSQSKEFQKSTLANRRYSDFLNNKYKVKGLSDLNGSVDLKEVKALLKTPKVPVIKFGYDGKFDGYVKDIRDEAKIVIDKLPKPSEMQIRNDAKYLFEKKILMTNNNNLTFTHEYGHHIDYTIGKERFLSTERLSKAATLDYMTLNIDDSTTLKSYFNKWFKEEEIYFTKGRNKGKLKGYLSVKREDTRHISHLSDIMDSLSAGKFRSKYFADGHGTQYYKTLENRMSENFANMFSIWSEKTRWNEAQELFPNLTKEFELIMKEVIDGKFN